MSREAAGGAEATPATAEQSRRVRRLYRLGAARWYDASRILWTRLTARQAEAAFDSLATQVARPDCRVLDIGCGTGFNLGRLQRLGIGFGSYHGIDVTDAMLAIARERYAGERRATFEEADLHVMEASPARYDLILSTWVASHLERPEELFAIAHRLLEPSGHALLLVFTRPRWFLGWFAPLAEHLFEARAVDPATLGGSTGLRAMERYSGGLVTFAHLEKDAPQAAPAAGG
jgi:SAM-dependent methyltransferase